MLNSPSHDAKSGCKGTNKRANYQIKHYLFYSFERKVRNATLCTFRSENFLAKRKGTNKRAKQLSDGNPNLFSAVQGGSHFKHQHVQCCARIDDHTLFLLYPGKMHPAVSATLLPAWMRIPLNPGTSSSRGNQHWKRYDFVISTR